MKTYSFEVFDRRDQYGMGMPSLQFTATSWKEAYETTLEALGARLECAGEESHE
jgi:hypothetical protein